MIVEASELGRQPSILTKPRQFAPQAVHSMASYLSNQEFADKAFLVLDWENVTGQLPDGAPVIPILYFQVVKDVPGKGQLRVEEKYDVDDIFGKDTMTPTILVDIVNGMKEAVAKAVTEKR